MRLSKSSVLIIPILIVLFLVSGHKPASAVNYPSGITVSPAFQQISIAEGKDKQPVSFSITNDKNVAQTIILSAADFNTLNESGGLFFVGTNPTALQKKYGLAKWFSISQNVVTIAPKQTQTIKTNILNLPDLSGGGHYGALMIRLGNSANGSTNSNNVAVDPIASSLMFVTKVGGDTHRLKLTNVNFNHSLNQLPDKVSLNFTNSGNSHVVPRGIVKLIGPRGMLISQGTINNNSNIILPESKRIYNIELRSISLKPQSGKYKLYIEYRFDGLAQTRGYQSSFWYVPTRILVLPVIAIALVIAICVYVKVRHKESKNS